MAARITIHEVVKILGVDGNLLAFFSEKMKDREVIVLNAVVQNSHSFRYASERLRNSGKFITRILRSLGYSVSGLQRCISINQEDAKSFLREVIGEDGYPVGCKIYDVKNTCNKGIMADTVYKMLEFDSMDHCEPIGEIGMYFRDFIDGIVTSRTSDPYFFSGFIDCAPKPAKR